MGWFGGGSGYGSGYRSSGTVTMPKYTTDTTVLPGDVPKMAETADLSVMRDGERRRLSKNGIKGTFTMGDDNYGWR